MPPKSRRRYSRAPAIFAVSLLLVSMASAVEFKVLYKFQGGVDGAYPYASLIFDAAGNLYGTTNYGGVYDYGTVFRLTPNPDGSWSETVIYSFTDTNGDGALPYASLIFDTAGNLYGTTYYGGAYKKGTVFKLAPNPDGSWSESVIHSFRARHGTNPYAGVIFDTAGNLYGTTWSGGLYHLGTAFKLTPNPDGSWSESVIHNFNGEGGGHPSAGLVLDAAGNLYGTTYTGGRSKCGTAFKLTPNPHGTWTKTKLQAFKGPNGCHPYVSLILDAAGNLYGTTVYGGAHGYGTAFKLTPNPDGSWTRTKLHAFKGPDGNDPEGELTLDAAGNLYGTTFWGGAYNQGTIFKLTPSPDGNWTRSTLHAFKGGDGFGPTAGIIPDAAGNLYGTTESGGKGYGVVFRITP